MLNLTLIQYYVNEYEMNNVWELKKGEKKTPQREKFNNTFVN